MTPDDLNRDLAADLQAWAASRIEGRGLRPFAEFIDAAQAGWPAALRRALFAEAEAARLRDAVAKLADRLDQIAPPEDHVSRGLFLDAQKELEERS